MIGWIKMKWIKYWDFFFMLEKIYYEIFKIFNNKINWSKTNKYSETATAKKAIKIFSYIC